MSHWQYLSTASHTANMAVSYWSWKQLSLENLNLSSRLIFILLHSCSCRICTVIVKCVANVVVVVAVSRAGSAVPLSEKENNYTSIVPFIGSPDKSATKVSDERRRGALSTIDVNSPIKVNWQRLVAHVPPANTLVCCTVKFCETRSTCGLWNDHLPPSQHWRCWFSRQWLFPWRFQIFQVMGHNLVMTVDVRLTVFYCVFIKKVSWTSPAQKIAFRSQQQPCFHPFLLQLFKCWYVDFFLFKCQQWETQFS